MAWRIGRHFTGFPEPTSVREVLSTTGHQPNQDLSYALWVVQILLAVLFLCTGTLKLVLPLDVVALQIPLPGLLVRSIGVCEVLGALGLILPGMLRIGTHMTPQAACGLVTIMIGATMFTPPTHGELVLLPLTAGILAAFVAYGRWRLAPLHRRSYAWLRLS